MACLRGSTAFWQIVHLLLIGAGAGCSYDWDKFDPSNASLDASLGGAGGESPSGSAGASGPEPAGCQRTCSSSQLPNSSFSSAFNDVPEGWAILDEELGSRAELDQYGTWGGDTGASMRVRTFSGAGEPASPDYRCVIGTTVPLSLGDAECLTFSLISGLPERFGGAFVPVILVYLDQNGQELSTEDLTEVRTRELRESSASQLDVPAGATHVLIRMIVPADVELLVDEICVEAYSPL